MHASPILTPIKFILKVSEKIGLLTIPSFPVKIQNSKYKLIKNNNIENNINKFSYVIVVTCPSSF